MYSCGQKVQWCPHNRMWMWHWSRPWKLPKKGSPIRAGSFETFHKGNLKTSDLFSAFQIHHLPASWTWSEQQTPPGWQTTPRWWLGGCPCRTTQSLRRSGHQWWRWRWSGYKPTHHLPERCKVHMQVKDMLQGSRDVVQVPYSMFWKTPMISVETLATVTVCCMVKSYHL